MPQKILHGHQEGLKYLSRDASNKLETSILTLKKLQGGPLLEGNADLGKPSSPSCHQEDDKDWKKRFTGANKYWPHKCMTK